MIYALLLLGFAVHAYPAPVADEIADLNRMALARTQAGAYDEAAAYYRKVLALNPAFVPARKNLGVVLWFANRKAEAEKIFIPLLATIPKDPVPHLYVGLAQYEKQRFASAKVHFDRAGDLAMRNPDVLPLMLDTYLSLRDQTIIPFAIGFSKETRDVAVAGSMAAIFDRHGRPEPALTVLTDAMNANPDDEGTYMALAGFSSAYQNNDYALRVLEQGLSRLPHSAILHLQHGLIVAMGGNRESAMRGLKASADANREWSLPHLAMGVVDLEAGHIDGAIEAFARGIELAPTEVHGYYFIALAWSRKGESGRVKAVEYLHRALKAVPGDVRSRVLLGQMMIAQGDLESGALELEQALRADPTNSAALYQLGLVHRKLGHAQLSRKYMAQFTASKAKAREEESALVQIMKIVK